MQIALIESDILWEQSRQNRLYYSQQIACLPAGTDIAVLPEFFTTGFSMNTGCAEEPDGASFCWMRETAQQYQIAVAGSLMIRQAGKVYNRFYFVCPDGRFFTYDKRHLFRYGGEDRCMTPGTRQVVFGYKEWRICPQICYDLRFPVWSRNRAPGYDLLLYVANFPAARHLVLDPLLRARAIENQAYVVFVNRTGTDGMGIDYQGGSCVVDYMGEVIKSASGNGRAPVVTCSLDALRAFRQKFPFWMDADDFILHS